MWSGGSSSSAQASEGSGIEDRGTNRQSGGSGNSSQPSRGHTAHKMEVVTWRAEAPTCRGGQ